MPQPTLVVVSGPPGSGKTQLAFAVALEMGCPVVSRDAIKEGMVHARGGPFEASEGDALTMRTYPLFFDAIRLLLEGGVSVVCEAAFQDRLWRQGLEPLLPLAAIRVIRCVVADDIARARMLRRIAVPTRAAHADAGWLGAPASRFDPISLNVPTLDVDTGSGYSPDLADVVRFVNAPLSPG